MTQPIAANASPFNCRWIAPGSEHQMGYAICIRALHTERLVNEADCARCPRWEEPDVVAGQKAALAWNNCAPR